MATNDGKLIEASKEYAKKATLLSDAIERAEAFLNALPGKVEAGAYLKQSDNSDSPPIGIVYEKHEGQWGLLLTYPTSGTEHADSPLAEASIAWKAMGAHLLPELFEDVCEQQQKIIKKVDDALAAIEAFEHPVLSARESQPGGEQ